MSSFISRGTTNLPGGVTKGQARGAQRPREHRPSAFNRPRRATPVGHHRARAAHAAARAQRPRAETARRATARRAFTMTRSRVLLPTSRLTGSYRLLSTTTATTAERFPPTRLPSPVQLIVVAPPQSTPTQGLRLLLTRLTSLTHRTRPFPAGGKSQAARRSRRGGGEGKRRSHSAAEAAAGVRGGAVAELPMEVCVGVAARACRVRTPAAGGCGEAGRGLERCARARALAAR